jgi:teichuronic acid biosynthesis glycosyltransferase TuaH
MTTPPADWSEVVVLCGATRWHGVRLLDQHLALGIAKYTPVLYIDPPLPWRPSGTKAASAAVEPVDTHPADGIEWISDRIALVTPRVLPGHQRPGIKAVTVGLVRRTIKRTIAELGNPRVRATIVPSLNRYFGAAGEERKVFYASDDFVAGAELMRLSPHRLQREMRRQPRDADLVVASSPALAETFRASGHDPMLLPNGVDDHTFARTDEVGPASDVWLPQPIAGYIGHLSSRIDARYLKAVAERGHSLLLIGACPRVGMSDELQSLIERPNVAWVGPREFVDLPSYLQLIDVGLVPYADTMFNRASFPLKALEYLGAGRPVVSSPIDAMDWLRRQHGDEAPRNGARLTDDDLSVVRDPEAFADRVEKAFVGGRDEAAIARRRAVARSHSWDSRFAELAVALDLTTPVKRTRVPR